MFLLLETDKMRKRRMKSKGSPLGGSEEMSMIRELLGPRVCSSIPVGLAASGGKFFIFFFS